MKLAEGRFEHSRLSGPRKWNSQPGAHQPLEAAGGKRASEELAQARVPVGRVRRAEPDRCVGRHRGLTYSSWGAYRVGASAHGRLCTGQDPAGGVCVGLYDLYHREIMGMIQDRGAINTLSPSGWK